MKTIAKSVVNKWTQTKLSQIRQSYGGGGRRFRTSWPSVNGATRSKLLFLKPKFHVSGWNVPFRYFDVYYLPHLLKLTAVSKWICRNVFNVNGLRSSYSSSVDWGWAGLCSILHALNDGDLFTSSVLGCIFPGKNFRNILVVFGSLVNMEHM